MDFVEKIKNFPVVYTAGPFRAKNGDSDPKNKEVQKNIQHAIDVSKKLIKNGILAMCPHANTHFEMPNGTSPEIFLHGDLKLIMSCDAILMLDRWWESEGARVEGDFAKFLGMPIYFETKFFVNNKTENAKPIIEEDDLGIHQHWLTPIDVRPDKSLDQLIKDKEKLIKYPQQFLMFRILQAKGYYLHVDKNHDYSPMNMKGTGIVGGATRLWDKAARYLNLIGFDVSTGEYTKPKVPKNESIEDTLDDMANYSYINRILLKKKWGK